jgi:hypothetical protein
VIYERALTSGVRPNDFWEMTLREVLCVLEGERQRDEMAWNHTSSVMSLLAQVNASKGKVFTPADFHPYLKQKPKKGIDTSTKEGVMILAERMKNI